MERSFVDSLDSLYQPQLSLNLNLLSTHHHHHHRQRGLYHSPSRRPFEVDARPADEAEYERYRRLTDLGEPYRLPRALLAGTKPGAPAGAGTPEAPLLVLINSRAGGRAGPRLTQALYRALGHAQVFELADHRPDRVLRAVWQNLQQRVARGDGAAIALRDRLVILAAGGDGTVAWVLKTLSDLKLEPAPPPVAVLPLGTGNDLALSFGWGDAFDSRWVGRHEALYSTLKRVADAEAHDLDTWHVRLSVSHPAGGGEGGTGGGETRQQRLPFEGLPHSLSLDENTTSSSSTTTTTTSVSGLFWNYFSIGADAAATHGFHSLRESKPWAAPARAINQLWYVVFGCVTGWFCGAPPASKRIRIRARRRPRSAAAAAAAGGNGVASGGGGEDGGGSDEEKGWVDIPLPRDVKAVVLLNLQSYAGGRDVWGLKDQRPPKAARERERGAKKEAKRLAKEAAKEAKKKKKEGGGKEERPTTPPATLSAPPATAAEQISSISAPPPPPPLQTSSSPSPSLPHVPADGSAGWSPPIFNDGLIEVVGLRSGWHAGIVMSGLFRKVHAKRLAQASDVELIIQGGDDSDDENGDGRRKSKGDRDDDCVYMQLDGEPWKQRVPSSRARRSDAAGSSPPPSPLVVRVSRAAPARFLLNSEKLPSGVSGRARRLAERERQVSISTQASLGRATLPSPARRLSAAGGGGGRASAGGGSTLGGIGERGGDGSFDNPPSALEMQQIAARVERGEFSPVPSPGPSPP